MVLDFLLLGITLSSVFFHLCDQALSPKPDAATCILAVPCSALFLYPFHSLVHMQAVFVRLLVAVQIRPVLTCLKAHINSFGSTRSTCMSGRTVSEMLCRKTVTEMIRTAKADCLTYHPYFALSWILSSFLHWIFQITFPSLLAVLIFYKSLSVFQSIFLIFLHLFDHGLNLHQ